MSLHNLVDNCLIFINICLLFVNICLISVNICLISVNNCLIFANNCLIFVNNCLIFVESGLSWRLLQKPTNTWGPENTATAEKMKSIKIGFGGLVSIECWTRPNISSSGTKRLFYPSKPMASLVNDSFSALIYLLKSRHYTILIGCVL